MKPIKNIKKLTAEMTQWRHELHREPELAFAEHATSRKVSDALKSFGCDEVHAMAGTGVVGVLHGKAGRKKAAMSIMLRAEMDALPLCDESGTDHASRTKGVHHACGHDGHMAMLLGAAKHLAATRRFSGTVYFVFQPAEERFGGAREMIKQGLFTRFPCNEVYAIHNIPQLPVGMMATGPGPMLASSAGYHVRLSGKGGHSLDSAVTDEIAAAAAEIALGVSALAKTLIPQGETALLSVSMLRTNSESANILPSAAEVAGGMRAFDMTLLDRMQDGIKALVAGVSVKYGIQAAVDFSEGYPVLVNSPAQTDFAVAVAREVVGAHAVMTPVPRALGVDDFAEFLKHRPGNFMALGTGRADGRASPGLHTAAYDFNDAALPIGANYWVRLVEKSLSPVKAGTPKPRP